MLMFTSTHRRSIRQLKQTIDDNAERIRFLNKVNRKLNDQIEFLHDRYGINARPVQNSQGKWINPKTGRFVKYAEPKT